MKIFIFPDFDSEGTMAVVVAKTLDEAKKIVTEDQIDALGRNLHLDFSDCVELDPASLAAVPFYVNPFSD